MDSITDLPLRRCTKCGETKPLSEFNKMSSYKDGLNYHCRQCAHIMRANRLDRAREQSRTWKKNHKAEDRELQRKWRQTPNGKRYDLHHHYLRRAQKKGGDVTTAQLLELSERQTHCAYCKRKFTSRLRPTIDHVIPVSKGGLHTISNLVLACKPCNCQKNNAIIRLI